MTRVERIEAAMRAARNYAFAYKTGSFDSVDHERAVHHERAVRDAIDAIEPDPIPMILTCPVCCLRHVDRGAFATKPHHTHACQGCGLVWRPARENTVGVQYLPGYKD